MRDALEGLGLKSLIRTTGGEGLHVLVPIARRHTHEEARRFGRVVASAVARAEPGLMTTETRVDRREGVYVDVKMNGHGQQIVAGYSVRPLPGAATFGVRHQRRADALGAKRGATQARSTRAPKSTETPTIRPSTVATVASGQCFSK